MVKFGKWKKILKLLLIVVVISLLVYFGVPFFATLLKTQSASAAVTAVKSPLTAWKTLFT